MSLDGRPASGPGDTESEGGDGQAYTITVDGVLAAVEGPGMRPLIHALRDDLDVTGPKVGCQIGVCGLCAVLLDDTLVSACLIPVAMAAGRRVTTVAGMTPEGGLSRLQSAFIECGAAQCGFCTPAQIVTATALLAEADAPTDEDIREWMAAALCRCTGYARIVEAVQVAARRETEDPR